MPVDKAFQVNIDDLTDQLRLACKLPNLTSDDRRKLVIAAGETLTALKDPIERLMTVAKWPVGHAVLRAAFNIKLFERFGTEGATAEELAVTCGVEHVLLVRILRALLGIGIFHENGPGAYVHNSISKALTDKKTRAIIRGMAETTDIMHRLPDYLAAIGFKNPNDRHNSFFSYAHETDLSPYEWLQSHPEQLAIFHDFQTATAQLNQGSFHLILKSLLTPLVDQVGVIEADKNIGKKILMVDVGGGRGDSLRHFRKETPALKGRIILQDLPGVVADQKSENDVEVMSHDFFTDQPVKGADIYFFRYIFHNWPDSACREILRKTISAMGADNSKIVINDNLLPDTEAGAFEAFLDIQMMVYGGMERTESQWRDLLAGVGLTIRGFQHPEKGSQTSECLIEAILE